MWVSGGTNGHGLFSSTEWSPKINKLHISLVALLPRALKIVPEPWPLKLGSMNSSRILTSDTISF